MERLPFPCDSTLKVLKILIYIFMLVPYFIFLYRQISAILFQQKRMVSYQTKDDTLKEPVY